MKPNPVWTRSSSSPIGRRQALRSQVKMATPQGKVQCCLWNYAKESVTLVQGERKQICNGLISYV
jgi:hypothetical protein